MIKLYRLPYIFSIILIIFIIFSKNVSAQQYCIDRSEFLRWLCYNVKGAEKACYDTPLGGNFPDFNSCERARTNMLTYDVRWQRMTKCVPCGGSQPSPPSPSTDGKLEIETETVEDIAREAREAVIQQSRFREQYRVILQQEADKKSREFKEMVSNLLRQIKISSAPISQFQREHYLKVIEQANCIASNAIKAAELALRGNFELSKNLFTYLETDLESVRSLNGYGFDNNILSCPKDIKFNIPQVFGTVENDPLYIKFIDITQKARTLLPRIEKNYKELLEIEKSKSETRKKIEQIEKEMKQIGNQIQSAKSPEEKTKANDLLAKAMALKEQAEADYQSALQEEQKLLQERHLIEKELNELKNKISSSGGL